MSYSRPSIIYGNSEDLPALDENDNISIDTTHLSQSFKLNEIPNRVVQPLSLEPSQQMCSVDSKTIAYTQQNAVNPYFMNLPSTRGVQPPNDANTFPRTNTILEKDWKTQHNTRIEEIADQAFEVIKESRSKLTKLITDVTVLFPFLKEKVVITSDDCDRIENQHLRSLKTDALIDVILTRGPEGMAYFYESLKIHYNHIYVTLKHIFEIKGIEIDCILDSSGRKGKGLSGYFCSIEEILGPKFAQERRDAQHLLDSISAVKMDNVISQDVQELKEKYIELQKHYEPIQHVIDTLTNDITTKYFDIQTKNEVLTFENEAGLVAIDKLCEENREIYEKLNTLHLKLELQQEELDRCKMENNEDENKSDHYKRILDLATSDEKLEMMKLHNQLQEEKNQNTELKEQIQAIRVQKDELFDLKEQVLKENVEFKKQLATFQEQGKKKNFEENKVTPNQKHMAQIKAVNNTLTRTKQEIDEALSKIAGKKSAFNEVTIKSSISITNIIKQQLAQSLEIGVFFSDNLDQSLVKSFQPGDRLLRINNIKLANVSNLEFVQFMMQQAENSLRLLVARGPISMEKNPFVEHNFVLAEDEVLNISRCNSPSVDSNRLTPVSFNYSTHISLNNLDSPRRTSSQSHAEVSIQGGFTSLNRPAIHDDSTLTRTHAESFELNKEFLSSTFENGSEKVSVSCPQTPLFNSNQDDQPYSIKALIANKTRKYAKVISVTSDSGSDTYSQDSDPLSNTKTPNSRIAAHEPPQFPVGSYFTHNFQPVTSPTVAKEFPGMENVDTMSDMFGSSRTDTGLTGMVIITRSKPTMRISPSAEDISLLLNKDQIRTVVPSDVFLKYAKISGGFGNPFFLSSSEELHQYKLKSGQKIFQIDDLTTEYLTYEMFIDQCNSLPSLTLFLSLKPSPHFKPDALSVRDHFYVIPHFTTKHITAKGELFISPSCVYLVNDTMVLKENTSRQNRFWHVTRIDPRNCKTIEEGIIPSDLWLKNSMVNENNSLLISIDSQLSQGSRSISSVSEEEPSLEHVSYYYDLDEVKERQDTYFEKSPFKCYTLVTLQDLPPQPVILFGYKWEEISEKMVSLNNTPENTKFQLITPTIIENVDHAKNAELEAKQKACEIIYYKGTDGKSRIVNIKALKDCAENHCTPVLLCPITLIVNAPGLVELNPIVIRLKFKYKYNSSSNKLDIPVDQRFHFDDMLRVGISEEKYSKKLVSMIDNNRVLYEWKSVVIEN